MIMTLRSSAFEQGGKIPSQYTGEGPDLSFPLAWDGVPEGVVEFALICDDADAPTPDPWVHWVAYKLSADLRSLPEGIAREATVSGFIQGTTCFTKMGYEGIGYNGPLPPVGHGTHHYNTSLYALNAAMPSTPGLTKSELLQAMHGHIIARANLVGTYRRD